MRDKITIFNHCMDWIQEHTIDGKGIAVSSKQGVVYPEVTGYYIPTLLHWGERELAMSYARHLCAIQKPDGSWYDSADKEPYVFDSAQILKGLIAVRDETPDADACIIKGCDWLMSRVTPEGRLTTPSKDAWGDDEGFCSEEIHLYCLSPLLDAARIYGRNDYRETAVRVKDYYMAHYGEKIRKFSLLSHFYAYVLEGLLDLGETEIVREAMGHIERYQNRRGGIPGLYNVKWVCSTGMFQLALVWYKLGELQKGNRIFEYACRLQNRSGGWYGSYPASVLGIVARGRKKAYYFSKEEISWANKYFLDALYHKQKLEFEKLSPQFIETIEKKDGRYRLVEDELRDCLEKLDRGYAKVCDVGCGKGRYLKNLMEEMPQNHYYACDISASVMKDLNAAVEKKTGGCLTYIPFADESFDYVYACEAMEHAVNIRGALGELWRIARKKARIVIIDKPAEQFGRLETEEWEQWLDDRQIRAFVNECHGELRIVKSVPYEEKDDGLFRAWIIQK